MKKCLNFLGLLMLSLGVSSCNNTSSIEYTHYEESTINFTDNSDPNNKEFNHSLYYRNDLIQDMGDPMMIYEDGYFYAYGTYDTTKIFAFRSKDLTNWENMGACFTPELESWSKTNIWAPDLQKFGDTWYLYYTAQKFEDNGKSYCQIGVATSDNPLGPFKQVTGVNGNGENIDLGTPNFYWKGHTILDQNVFLDDDGQYYMYFSFDTRDSVDPNYNTGQAEIYGVKMIDPVTWDLSTLTRILAPGYQKITDTTRTIEWETWSPSFAGNMECLEGPYMIKKNGKYILTYCANSYVDTEYAVGYAISDNPLTGFYKPNDTYLENMLLGVPGQTGTYINTRYLGFQTGTGHASICKVGDEYMFAYHAHYNRDKWGAHEDIYGDKATYRALAVDYLYFDSEGMPYTNGPTWSLVRLPSEVSGYKNIALETEIKVDGEVVSNLNDNYTNRAFNTSEENRELNLDSGTHVIEINLEKETSVKAVNIYNSYDYTKKIDYINQIDFGNNNGVTNILFNSNYVNNETKFVFPHSAFNVELEEEINTSRIVIEIESQKDFALGEIEILGR